MSKYPTWPDFDVDISKELDSALEFRKLIAQQRERKEVEMPSTDNSSYGGPIAADAPRKETELDMVLTSIEAAIGTAEKALARIASVNTAIFGPTAPSTEAGGKIANLNRDSVKAPKIASINRANERLHGMLDAIHNEISKTERL